MTTPDLDPLGNRLLAGLPRADFELLRPYLLTASFAQGTVLAEHGDEIKRVVFPLSGMISLFVVMKDGKAIETAAAGRDGVFGASVAFGVHKSTVRAIVQIQMNASFLTSARFRQAANSSQAIQLLCIDYNETLLAQARVTAACNALHSVESRLCRWLLQIREVTQSEPITLTQEFLSEMLGVRRTSVTEVARRLQGAGLITYARGVINILDMPGLQVRACECLQTLRELNAV